MFRPSIEAARTGGRSVVVEAALRDPVFVRNNVGGPFAARIAADAAFREEVLAPSPEAYQKVLIDCDGNIFGRDVPFVCVPESFIRTGPRPLFIIPGIDVFHPTEISRRICAEALDATCLEPDCREPRKLEENKRRLRGFFDNHAR